MKKLGRTKDDIYFELWHQHKDVARKINLKQTIEEQTGCRVSDYFRDRKSASILLARAIEWALQNFKTVGSQEKVQLLKTEESDEKIAKHLGWGVFRDMLDHEFGKDRMIAIGNKILADPQLRDEFYAEGGAVSSRDFSYLLSSK